MNRRKRNNTDTAKRGNAVFIQPYVTEKTFNAIEKENKLTFIVSEKATKMEIINALKSIYESEAIEVNTARTIQGKKAIIKFKSSGGARELATRLGLV
ncbi:MAG TPA: 50S ribosomal protein L23 [Nitrososphaeraceae archaeon]